MLDVGDIQSAIQVLKEILDIDSEPYSAYYLLGKAYADLKCWSQSTFFYQKALAIDSYLISRTEEISRSWREFREQQPVAIQQAYLDLAKNPRDSILHAKLANLLHYQGYLQEAIHQYNTALKLDVGKSNLFEKNLDQIRKQKRHIRRAFYEADISPLIYAAWVKENTPSPQELEQLPYEVGDLNYKYTISIIVPTYNTPELVLRDMLDSVLAQIYPFWELCIADDCSSHPHVSRILAEYAELDERIKPVFRAKNGHISAASNSALEIATGEFVGLLDHDDELSPDALLEVARLLNQHPEADFIYSDEDKRSLDGERTDPFFKPDW
ncbi:MAG: glycosyltransferase [Okeania sp. SIO2F5]|nr:glycosyltransferase [Okeania sp. SIO2F5]